MFGTGNCLYADWVDPGNTVDKIILGDQRPRHSKTVDTSIWTLIVMTDLL